MTRRQWVIGTLIAAALSLLVSLGLDLTGLLDYSPFELALSFPLGAAAFLFIGFLSEKAGA